MTSACPYEKKESTGILYRILIKPEGLNILRDTEQL